MQINACTLSLAFFIHVRFMWNVDMWWILVHVASISGYDRGYLLVCFILGPTYRTWICSWLQLDLGGFYFPDIYMLHFLISYVSNLLVFHYISMCCDMTRELSELTLSGCWISRRCKMVRCWVTMDTWIEVLNEKSLFETEIDHKQWGDFTTWQVLIFYQEVYLCHQIGHLHKRNLIVHTQSLVLSEGQSSVVLGLLGFKMESETLLFIQGVNVYLKSLTLLNLDDEIDLWNWNCTLRLWCFWHSLRQEDWGHWF